MTRFFLTFGQKYRSEEKHPAGGHPDGWFEIVAEDMAQARRIAFAVCGDKFSTVREEKDHSPELFPMGRMRLLTVADLIATLSDRFKRIVEAEGILLNAKCMDMLTKQAETCVVDPTDEEGRKLVCGFCQRSHTDRRYLIRVSVRMEIEQVTTLNNPENES